MIWSADPVVTRKGTLNCWATAVAAAVTELEYPPVRTGTFSREISFSTADRPTSGFPVSSSKSSSSFFPLTPPLALISSAAISNERFSISPNFACSPVSGRIMPTLMDSAAPAGFPKKITNTARNKATPIFLIALIDTP